MKKSKILIPGFLLGLGLFAGYGMAAAPAGDQSITRAGSNPTVDAPSQYFTGRVKLDMLFGPKAADAPFGAAYVTFEPGARSHWHTHPTGQHLIVTSGVGRTGTWNGQVEEIREGDVLWCPPGIKHWHGAAPDSPMTHLALTGNTPDGKNVDWMEAVSDEQYNPR